MTRITRAVGDLLLRPRSPRGRLGARPTATLRELPQNVEPPAGTLADPPPQVPTRCPSRPASALPSTTAATAAAAVATGVSYYRRELPSDLISFTSYLGRLIFKEALDEGAVENYFSLVGNFTHQSETAFCGLGSLAMVLNALEVDPGRTWKGVWRWYSDDMLECCSPLDLVKERGITFEQFVRLAQCHGLAPQARRFDQTTYEQFREDLRRTATEPGCHMVVSFSRQALGQTGIGHFSPIGAYQAERGLALVLDVARFKYPSYWAPIDKLWASMEPVDPDTNAPRGYIMLRQAFPRITGCP